MLPTLVSIFSTSGQQLQMLLTQLHFSSEGYAPPSCFYALTSLCALGEKDLPPEDDQLTITNHLPVSFKAMPGTSLIALTMKQYKFLIVGYSAYTQTQNQKADWEHLLQDPSKDPWKVATAQGFSQSILVNQKAWTPGTLSDQGRV